MDDIEEHEARLSQVLTQHEELCEQTGRQSPTHQEALSAEISQLREDAIKKRDTLQEVVNEQVACEEEVGNLTEEITIATEDLCVPIAAVSAEALQMQIEEHKVGRYS